MRAIRAILSGLLALGLTAPPAGAQFSGVTFTGGAANYPAPDFSMCDFNVPTTFTNVWYVDPTPGNGDTQNNYTTAGISLNPSVTPHQGDSTHPWSSLQAVFTTQTGYPRPLLTTASGGSGTLSPINPGDEILLNTGTAAQYGAISTNGLNPTYLKLAAAPGQSPQLTSLIVSSGGRIAFQGIAAQKLSSGTAIINNSAGKNVVFDGVSASSTDYATAATWTTQAQWNAGTTAGVNSSAGFTATKAASCTLVQNSHFFILANGIPFSGTADHLWLQNNEIDHWTQDALDYAGSFIVIDHNHLHDPVGVGSGVHMDFMQGFCLCGKTNHDIWINGNLEIFQEDPGLPFVGTIEVIGAPTGGSGGTNGAYTNIPLTGGGGTGGTANITIAGGAVTVVTIVNKGLGYSIGDVLSATVGSVTGFHVTVTNVGAYNGGITQTNDQWTDLFITNNLISIASFPAGIGIGGCNDCLMANNTTTNSIEVNASSIGRGSIYRSSNITVTNNISSYSTCTDTTPSVNMTNNMIMKGNFGNATVCFGGVISANFGASGGVSLIGGNFYDSGGIASELTTIDPVGLIYNFHLLSTAPARGLGQSALPRPLVDNLGRIPNSPPDAGALAFP